MNIFLKAGLVAVGLLVAATVATNVFASPISNAASTVYKMSITDKFGNSNIDQGICSAVAVSPTQIVTANHCVDHNYENVLRIDNVDISKDFKVLSSSLHVLNKLRTLKDLDVAMLELADSSMKFESYAKICDEFEPVIGDEMTAIGFPRADKKMVTSGYFGEPSALKDLGFKGPFWKTSVPIIGGNSGGGLFVEKDGELCLAGIASAAYPYSFESYWSPLKNIKEVTKFLLKLDPEGEKNASEIEPVDALKKSEMSLDQR